MSMDQRIAGLDCDSPNFAGEYAQVLNWIHYEVELGSLKKELVRYLKQAENQEIIDSLPLAKMTIEGAIAYCLNRGAKLSPLSRQRIQNFVDLAHSESPTEIIWEPIVLSAAGTGVITLTDCIGRIDNLKTLVLCGKLSPSQLPDSVRLVVGQFANNRLAIIRGLLKYYQTCFKEVQSDPLVKSWVQPLNIINQTLGLMCSSKTSVKTGAKAALDRVQNSTFAQRDLKGDKAAKNITISTEANAFGLTGVSPANIVGAKIAVVFNLKTKVLEVYYAAESQTLSVKGARITNINPEISEGRVIRDPKTMLPHWCNASSPRRVEVLAQGIKGKSKPSSGKLNHNSLILKVL